MFGGRAQVGTMEPLTRRHQRNDFGSTLRSDCSMNEIEPPGTAVRTEITYYTGALIDGEALRTSGHRRMLLAVLFSSACEASGRVCRGIRLRHVDWRDLPGFQTSGTGFSPALDRILTVVYPLDGTLSEAGWTDVGRLTVDAACLAIWSGVVGLVGTFTVGRICRIRISHERIFVRVSRWQLSVGPC